MGRARSVENGMNYRDEIISSLANSKCKTISQRVIRGLIKTKDGMQSGHDTPMKNLWDEICVQVQDEESAAWDAYLETIQSHILCEVADLDDATRQAIWLQTHEGMDWEVEDKEDQKVPIVDEDIAQYILNRFVLSAAADWTSKRIEKYLEREHD